MDMKIGECVGICKTDDKGHIIKIVCKEKVK